MAFVQPRVWVRVVPPLLLAILVAFLLPVSTAQNVVSSVGGFVTIGAAIQEALSDTGAQGSVDLTEVRIVVLSPQGFKKSEGDCSPNGYYFVPIDAGTYTVAVQGPPGWIFSPPEALITCNGHSCNGAEDVNFELIGIELSGHVEAGSAAPSCKAAAGSFDGIRITVKAAGSSSKATVAQVVDSSFSTGRLLPGKYILTASHPDWQLSPAQTTHTLTLDSTQLLQPFKITGYTLSGRVTSRSGPVAGIQVTLLSSELTSAGCSTTHPPGAADAADIESALGTTALCSVLSDANGQYSFPGVACGQYRLQAQHPDPSSTFEVEPSIMTINVRHGNLLVQQAFTVTGFSVQGRVVDSTGSGVAGVDVSVAGQVRATTGLTGSYFIPRMHEGRLDVSADKKHYTFSTLKAVHVTPTAQLLPDIVVQSVSVCGRLAYGESRFKVNARRVSLTSADAGSVTKQTMADASDSFCFSVPPGQYRLAPYITADEKNKGLVFSPTHADIVISGEPVANVVFSQAQLAVAGSVVCLDGPCPGDVHITLKDAAGKLAASARLEEVAVKDKHSTGNSIPFQLNQVSPGQYTLTASKVGWCWSDEQGVQVVVDAADVEAAPLKQAGYQLQVSSTHAANLTIEGPTPDSFLSIDVGEGLTRLCMPGSGTYTITPQSCFVFGPDGTFTVEVKPNRPQEALTLRATQVYVRGTIQLAAAAADKYPSSIDIIAEVVGSQPPQVLATEAVASDSGAPGVFSYSLAIELGATITVTPSVRGGAGLLFYPRSVTYMRDATANTCPPALDSFEAKPGNMLSGVTEPAVAGAQVNVTFKGASAAAGKADGEAAAYGTTDAAGSFTLGPLYGDAEYHVELYKPGYIFTLAGVNSAGLMKFITKQLARVTVNVEIPSTIDPESVFLSLSGSGGFKNNARLGSHRSVEFVDLQPRTYYLKPLLREHQFDPPMANLTLEDGQAVEVTLTAVRTAWGISGVVTSVGGSPLAAVVVEACQGTGAASMVLDSSLTDDAGKYRIGNLKADATYEVRLKLDGRVISAHPVAKQVKMQRSEVSGIDFVAFRSSSRPTLSAALKLPSDLRNAIKAKLLPAGPSGSVAAVIAATTVDGSGFFEMPGLKPGSYVLQLSCNTAAAGGRSCQTWEQAVQVPARDLHLGVLPFKAAPLSMSSSATTTTAQISDEGLDWKLPLLVLILLVVGCAAVLRPAVVEIFQLRPVVSGTALSDIPAGFAPVTNTAGTRPGVAAGRNGSAATRAAASLKAAAAIPLQAASAPLAVAAKTTLSEAAAEPLPAADDDGVAEFVDGGSSGGAAAVSSGAAKASGLKQRSAAASQRRARRA